MSDYTTRGHEPRTVDVFDEVARLPVAAAAPAPPPPPVEIGLGFVIVSANVFVTLILIAALLVDGTQAGRAILTGSVYFALTTAGFALVTTGALSAIVATVARERTERQRVAAYRALGELAFAWRLAVEETRQIEMQARRPAAESVQRLSPLTTYVPAVAEGEEAQSEGIRFALSLYGTTGHPDPQRVHSDGRLRVRMLGSKRGSGSRAAGLWLLREGIIRRVAGGYALDVKRYPTRDALRAFL